jgi:hypothetical protein
MRVNAPGPGEGATLAIAGGNTLDVEGTGGADLEFSTVTGVSGAPGSTIEIGADTAGGSILMLDDGVRMESVPIGGMRDGLAASFRHQFLRNLPGVFQKMFARYPVQGQDTARSDPRNCAFFLEFAGRERPVRIIGGPD